MFSVHCPTHGTEVLLSDRCIEGIRSRADGHDLHWRCWCGTRGSTFVPRLELAVDDPMVGRHRPAV